MTQTPDERGARGEEGGWPRPTPPPSNPLASLRLEDLRAVAAAAIVIAVVAMLLGALVLGLATDTAGTEGWKLRVKAVGLGTAGIGPPDFSPGGAAFIGLSLLVALALLADASRSILARWARVVEIGAGAAAIWVMLFTLLGLVVDLTEIADFPEVVGVLLIDLATLLVLALAAVWGLRTFIPTPRR